MTSPDGEYPVISDLLPHAGPWVLLSRVLDHGPEHTSCGVTVSAERPVSVPRGRVPGFVGLEYMAQCIAVHGALASPRGEGGGRVGLLLGARRVEIPCVGFLPEQLLEVNVHHVWGDRTLFLFDCSLRDAISGEVLMQGELKVYRGPSAGAES